MKPTDPTAPTVPQEAIEAYNLYIHGKIDRRSFLDRVRNVAGSAVAASVIVDQLMPSYGAAQQVSTYARRLETEYVTVPTPQGTGRIKGYLVSPAKAGAGKLRSILVIHENRGLNPHIEDVARR